MDWSNPLYWAVGAGALAVLLLHSWLSRRRAVWLGAVVPALALIGLVYTGIVYGDGRGLSDFVRPAIVIVLLLITWANGHAARHGDDSNSQDE